jgi:acyl carrier protein
MSNLATLETAVRTFIREELMFSQIDFMKNDEPLDLSSLAQTELRVFLEEDYHLDIGLEAMPYETAETLDTLLKHMSEKLALPV